MPKRRKDQQEDAFEAPADALDAMAQGMAWNLATGERLPLERIADNRHHITGLVFEDAVRTCDDLFPKVDIPQRPTAPVDIAPILDLVHGIPTHVKSVKVAEGELTRKGNLAGGVDMACAWRLVTLRGHNRLVVGLYDEERWFVRGRVVDVKRYHTIIEIIISPATVVAFLGGLTVEEVLALKRNMAAAIPETDEEVEEAKRRFHPVTAAWRAEKRMGIARISNKIGINQARPQASVSLEAFALQMAEEDDFEGAFTMPNHRIYRPGESFHGMELPWRTLDEISVFTKAVDPDAQPRRKARRGIDTSASRWSTEIDDGTVAVEERDGDLRAVIVDEGDDAVRRRVSRLCRDAGGAWIEDERAWHLAPRATRDVLHRLTGRFPRPLPPADGPSIMRYVENRKGDEVYEFDTPDGPIRAIKFASSNWALRPQDSRRREDRIAWTCRSTNVGRFYKGRTYSNWLIPHDPPELMERVARAIRDHPGDRW